MHIGDGMSDKTEYLVISRGRWDDDKSPEQIQQAIDDLSLIHI